MANDVVDDRRLRAANENGAGSVRATSRTVAAGAIVVEFQGRVRQPEIRLMNFNGVKAIKTAFYGVGTAAVGDHCVVDTAARVVADVETAPVARRSQGAI